MANAHDVSNEIISFLNSGRGKSEDHLKQLAADYNVHCESANARLRRCADYLRRGLRPEAIHHAEVEPDLLDQMTALDFARIGEWNTICQDQGIEPAPQLMIDVAQELNEAYVVVEPMRDLLIRFRWLSLKRAQVRDRLKVLRSLMKLDPNNTVWDSDIKEFEQVRLNEIAADGKVAAEDEDLERLGALASELTQASWRVSVPKKLLGALESLIRRVQVNLALREVDAVLPELNDAYSALDTGDVSNWLDRLDQIVATNELQLPAHVEEQVQPIRAWLLRLDEDHQAIQLFTDACAQLTLALDQEAPSPDLRRLYTNATSFDQPIPTDLQRRYELELSQRDLAQTRSSRRRFYIVMSVLFFGTAIAIPLIHFRGIEHKNRGDTKHLNKLVDAGELEKAVEWKNACEIDNKNLKTYPDWDEAVEILYDKRADEDKREAEFQKHYQDLEARRKGLVQVVFPSSDEQTARDECEQLFDWIQDADELIADAEALQKEKRTENEEEKIADLVDPVRQRKEERQLRIGKLFDQRYDKIQSDFDKVRDDSKQTEHEVSLATYRRIESDAEKLVTWPGIGAHSEGSAEELLEDVKAEIKREDRSLTDHRRKEELRSRIAELSQHTHSAQELAGELESIVDRFPDSREAEQFEEAIANSSSWKALEAWGEFVRACDGKLLVEDHSLTGTRAERVKDYLQRHSTASFKTSIKAYEAYLIRAQTAEATGSSRYSSLEDFLITNPLIYELMVTRSGDETYYTKDEADCEGYHCHVVLLPEGFRKLERIISENKFTRPEKAPQRLLADRIIAKAKRQKPIDWEIFGLESAEMIRADSQVDVIFKAWMLYKSLELINAYAWGVDEELASVRKALTDLGAENPDKRWLNPREKRLDKTRSRMEAAMQDQDIAALGKISQTVRDKRAALVNNVNWSCSGAGVIVLDGERRAVQINNEVVEGQKLWIISSASKANRSLMTEIGTVSGGKANVDTRHMPEDLPAGSLVFSCDLIPT